MGKKARERHEKWIQNSLIKNFTTQPRFVDFMMCDPTLRRDVDDLIVVSGDEVSDYISLNGNEAINQWRELPIRPVFDELFLDVSRCNFWTKRFGAVISVVEQNRVFHETSLHGLSVAEATILIERRLTPQAARYIDIAIFTEDRLGIELSTYIVLPINEQGIYLHDREKFAAMYIGRLAERSAQQHPEYDPVIHEVIVAHEPDRLRILVHPLLDTIIMSLALMNCRNISLIDRSPDPTDSAIFRSYFHAPMLKYKTLSVRSMSKIVVS